MTQPVTPPVISAVICTYNRAPYLRKAIDSLLAQTLDPGRYEILIVDNRSTDDTRPIVEGAAMRSANVRYVYEPIQGLSQARNTAWQQASGPYIAYLDDDAVAAPDWLEGIVRAFETVTPRPGVVGGKISPIWEAPRPDWLSDRVALGLTILDWSETPFFVPHDLWLAGANVAYRRELLEATHGFDVTLGRTGNNLISCEEALLNHRIREMGHPLYYHPHIAVQHHIAASRLTRDWHLKRQYWNGVSVAVTDRRRAPLSLMRRARRAWTAIARDGRIAAMRLLRARGSDEAEQFDARCALVYYAGYAYGLLKGDRARAVS